MTVESTDVLCRQRGCLHFGLWHSAASPSHRARTIHTALAAVSIEKADEQGPWTVWLTPHGENERQVTAAPDPRPDLAHQDYMELRAAVNYALRTAQTFNA